MANSNATRSHGTTAVTITLSGEQAQHAADAIRDLAYDGFDGRDKPWLDAGPLTVADLERRSGSPPLSGLKDQLRRRQSNFSEKDFGYGGFLQFVKAAARNGVVELEWDDDAEDYYLSTGAI